MPISYEVAVRELFCAYLIKEIPLQVKPHRKNKHEQNISVVYKEYMLSVFVTYSLKSDQKFGCMPE